MAEVNKVTLVGTFLTDFRQYTSPIATSYRAAFGVKRKSGFVDVFRVITFEDISITKVKGDSACIVGRVITRDTSKKEGAPDITTEVQIARVSYFGYTENSAHTTIIGNVVGRAHYRYTPKGSYINNFAVAAPRKNGKTDLIHVIAWDEKAKELSDLANGEPIKVQGRLQTRVYTKKSDKSKHKVVELSLYSYERGIE